MIVMCKCNNLMKYQSSTQQYHCSACGFTVYDEHLKGSKLPQHFNVRREYRDVAFLTGKILRKWAMPFFEGQEPDTSPVGHGVPWRREMRDVLTDGTWESTWEIILDETDSHSFNQHDSTYANIMSSMEYLKAKYAELLSPMTMIGHSFANLHYAMGGDVFYETPDLTDGTPGV
jgi:hypothetical protein